MIRFDWYQATVYVSDPQDGGLLDTLLAAWELSDLAPDRGMHGYTHGAKIVRGDTSLCRIWWGGNPGVNITASSEQAPILAEALKRIRKPYGITRMDSCIDWNESGMFDTLSAYLIEYAKQSRITINQQGDWTRGVARTLYLGSPQSPVRICLYEKGYEQGGDAPRDWVRLEVRIKPKGQHKLDAAAWPPEQVFASGWVHDALAPLGWDLLEKRSVGVVWRPSDVERSRRAFLRQYGTIIAQWADEAGGWETFGTVLKDALETV